MTLSPQVDTSLSSSSSEYICVHCGAPVPSLFREYSKGNIRLSRCLQCSAFADAYVEMESKLVFIDLVLHKTPAYRHVFMNQKLGHANKQVTKFLVLIFAFDSFDRWFSIKKSFEFPWEEFARWLQPHDFQWLIPAVAILETIVFISALCVITRVWLRVNGEQPIPWRFLANSIIVSCFSKVGVLLWMVWDAAPIHRKTISFFTLTSNVLALRVMLKDTGWTRAGLIVSLAFLVKVSFCWISVIVEPSLSFKFI
jgi:hypothetical protein